MRPGYAEISANVDIYVNRERVPELSKEIMGMKDRDVFKKIIGDNNARVSVGIDEHMGGPYNYSGIKIRVNVTLSADQTKATIQEAEELAFQECVQFIDDHLPQAYKLLEQHLERLSRSDS